MKNDMQQDLGGHSTDQATIEKLLVQFKCDRLEDLVHALDLENHELYSEASRRGKQIVDLELQVSTLRAELEAKRIKGYTYDGDPIYRDSIGGSDWL